MSQDQSPHTGTDIVLSDRQNRLLNMRDEMAPGQRPMAIVPRTFAEAQAMCSALAHAAIIPAQYRAHPEDMIVTVMSGAEIGIPPMQALRLYHIIEGVPRLGAEGIRAIVLASPLCEYLEPATMSPSSVTWVAKRRGRPEKSSTWNLERAKVAGLLGKQNWAKSPQDMMNARCSMELARLIWPDLAAALVSAEEANDGDVIDASYTETPEFRAPPVVVVAQPAAAQPVTAAAPEAPRRGRPPRVAEPAPSPVTAPATNLDAAKEAVASKAATDRFGQNIAPPTPAASTTAPSPSIGSASPETTTAAVSSGAEFDDDPEDAPAPALTLEQKIAPLTAWLASVKTLAQLDAGRDEWAGWSRTTFPKGSPEAAACSKAFATKKASLA